MSHETSLLKRSKQLLGQLWNPSPKEPEITEHETIRNLILAEKVDHLESLELFEFIQELKLVNPESDPTAAARIENLERIYQYVLLHSFHAQMSLNQDWDHMSFPDLPTGSNFDSFPMEVFLDYSEPTPEFHIGDLVWVRSALPHLAPDGGPCYRAVIVARTLDLEDFYYIVGPYEDGMEMCDPQPFEVDEQDISYDRETFDPMRNRLSVVKG